MRKFFLIYGGVTPSVLNRMRDLTGSDRYVDATELAIKEITRISEAKHGPNMVMEGIKSVLSPFSRNESIWLEQQTMEMRISAIALSFVMGANSEDVKDSPILMKFFSGTANVVITEHSFNHVFATANTIHPLRTAYDIGRGQMSGYKMLPRDIEHYMFARYSQALCSKLAQLSNEVGYPATVIIDAGFLSNIMVK